MGRRRRGGRAPEKEFDAAFSEPLVATVELLGELRRLRGPSVLTEVEDRRTWHPVGLQRPARLIDGRDAKIEVKKPVAKRGRLFSSVPAGLQFQDAKHVSICVRRKQRREVLFAEKKAGRGGARHRRVRRNSHSDISC